MNAKQELGKIGGKAFNLKLMEAAGFPVPPFFAVDTDAYRATLDFNRDHGVGVAIDELIEGLVQVAASSTPDSFRDQVEGLQEVILQCELPEELISSIRAQYDTITSGKQTAVAVRSSATDEDGADHSFAGMHDSFMYLYQFEDVLEAVKRVWASAFNERAISYRIKNGISLTSIAVAVVVQKMIDARAAGVAFTCNPASSRTDEIVVSSVWGAGEGLVSHGLAADTFVVKKSTLSIESTVVDKPRQLLVDEHQGKGLKETDVPGGQQSEPSLTQSQIETLSETAIKLENYYRRPQDIEFCWDEGGELFVLQTRPVTQLKEYGPAAGNPLTWDNSNIIESYSGVTTPMTFSFIRRAYTIVYHCFAEVMGISPKKVKASRHVFENMLGLIRGRVFYNIENWYRLIRLFPGYEYNAQFMESMMGLKETLELDEEPKPPGFFRKYFVELPSLVRLVGRTLWNFIRIRPAVAEFEANFLECYSRWDAMDFSEYPPHQLKALYHEMEDALLWNWKAPIINDFYVMIYFGLLRKFCQDWAHDETGALQNDLICGEGGVESAEPAKMLLRLASSAIHNEPLKQTIFSEPLEEVPAKVQANPEFAEFETEMQRYLKLYGFRCMNELKLEEFSLRDRPHTVYQVLRNYLALEDPAALDVDAMHEREQRVRREAEERAFSEVGKGFRWYPKKWIFKRVLRNARAGVKNRENMRFARTRIYGIVRELLRAIGQHLADEQIIGSREDIFYLTIDEIWDFIKGTAVTANLRELADLRRAEFDEYRAGETPDDRFETFGYVYHKNLFIDHDEEEVDLKDGQLKGTGCCPGELTNVVRVLRSPQDNLSLSGQILVAERTDPGWVPLYPAVSGILIERGSVLSHSAVVAREMGIPTIVGIKGLLASVKDGDTVTMNGASGIVQLPTDETQGEED